MRTWPASKSVTVRHLRTAAALLPASRRRWSGFRRRLAGRSAAAPLASCAAFLDENARHDPSVRLILDGLGRRQFLQFLNKLYPVLFQPGEQLAVQTHAADGDGVRLPGIDVQHQRAIRPNADPGN